MNRPTFVAALLLVSGAAGLSGCSPATDTRGDIEEPFGFAAVRELAQPISRLPSDHPDALEGQLRRDGKKVSLLYRDTLNRFDAIYGNGIGPAKSKSDYIACKSAFHDVGTLIQTLPISVGDQEVRQLWAQLLTCRQLALQWSGPVEMATFGKDLLAMTEGSMLVLSYAASASNSPLGVTYYRELAAPKTADTGPS